MENRAPAFTAWLDLFFEATNRHRPVNATYIGIHEHDHLLPDLSERGVADAESECAALVRRLRDLPVEPLTEAQDMDRRLAEGHLKIERWESASRHFVWGNPCVYTSEAIFGVMSLFLRRFAPLAERVEAAIARMEAVRTLLEQGRANVREAPLEWTSRAIRECQGALAFFGEGIDILAEEEGCSHPRFRDAATGAGTAFEEFLQYLERELAARPSGTYHCGRDVLELLLNRGHFLDRSADDVEAQAWEALAASEAHLTRHVSDFGHSNWRETLEMLTLQHPTAERYTSRYQELWEACRKATEEHRLLTWPDYPIRYVAQPAWARAGAPYLYFLPYRSPAPFDDLPVVEYLVTPIEPDLSSEEKERRLRLANDGVIKLNHVVHHGGPGHHVQNWYAYRAESRIGQVAAVDCASRIAFFCGGTMAEGWACYASDLMEEIGFLTPLENLAEAATRLRMAARAVVDVRLHSDTWSFKEAVSFYRDRAGMSEEAARSETVKNSMFPGTALMYLVGTDLIRDLRREISKERGPSFSLSAFHDRFLSYGSVPVTMICRSMTGNRGNPEDGGVIPRRSG